MQVMGDISVAELRRLSLLTRIDTMQIIYDAGGGHTGGSLSAIDILLALYMRVMNVSPQLMQDGNRDRFIMSKGHSVEAYYSVLAAAGFITKEELHSYGTMGTSLYGHPTMKVAGVEIATGALGHGLAPGVGLALAGKRDRRSHRVFVLMGDGEQAEGSVWEAAMAASNYALSNLIGIIDYNKLQISGSVEDVMRTSPLREKWEAFGWHVSEIDGHDFDAILDAFAHIPHDPTKPHLVIAHTTKGKGVSFIENNAGWHHKVPSEEQLSQAHAELRQQMERD